MANVEILNEVCETTPTNSWRLCFQFCRFKFDDGSYQDGYRFIWRRPDNSLQAARGQARIPSIARLLCLVALAIQNGWGGKDGDA